MTKKTNLKWFQKRSCLDKVYHKTYKDAIEILLKQRNKGYDVDHVYKCPFCKYYHIGHYKNRTRIKNLFALIGEFYGN